MSNRCKDINGNDLNNFYFSDEGVVYGLVNTNGSQTTYEGTTLPYNGDGDLVNLSIECCDSFGFEFDSNNSKCYYKEVTTNATNAKIVFNIDENDGLIFSKLETEECSLNLQLDYLIEYDSTTLYTEFSDNNVNVIDLINGLDLSVVIEKYGFREINDGENYESNKILTPIFEEGFYSIITPNESTGVILSGTKIDIINNKLKNELGNLYNAQILDSDWLKLNITINDPQIITDIINEEVKFSIQINQNICDFSIILDNINFNKICSKTYKERRTIDKSPSFNLEKVVDNKKSWTNIDSNRFHDLQQRETEYKVDDDRLIVNSKEMELSTSASDAIVLDVARYSIENNTLILGIEGEDHTSIDLSSLMVSDFNSIKTPEELTEVFRTELIDVKSRKSSVMYPTLSLIYERYLESEIYGSTSNKYTYDKVTNFINLLGGHWVDLIEQVVPSTTLWGSTNRVSNTLFKNSKFSYKRYNLLFCNRNNETVLTEKNGVEVIISSVDEDETFFDKCDNIYIKSLSDDCSTIGVVTIVGNEQILNEE